MNNIRTYLVNLPTRIPGMLTVDENGEPMIYLNARLSSVQHKLTYDHELKHLEHDDLNNDDPIELVEARASGKIPPKPDTPINHLEVSPKLQAAAQELFGLSPNDRRWNEIWWAMLVTGLPDQPGRPSSIDKNRTYYYPPVKIKRGRMFKGPKRTPKIDYLEQTWALQVPGYYR
jgi:hypothetical protein